MFQTLLVQPIYNAFVALLHISPGGDVGIAIIVLTIIIRAIFYPLFASSIRTQMAMQVIQPELAEIQEKYKDDAMEKAKRQSELFKRHRIHPFTMIGTIIVQFAVFIALYFAFFKFGLPEIRTDLLYSFVPVPQKVNEIFLGFVDLAALHNIVIVLLVGLSQFAAMYFTLQRTGNALAKTEQQIAIQKMQKNMMLYFFPVMIGFVSYVSAAAVGLYFIVGSLVSLAQEWIIRRKPL